MVRCLVSDEAPGITGQAINIGRPSPVASKRAVLCARWEPTRVEPRAPRGGAGQSAIVCAMTHASDELS